MEVREIELDSIGVSQFNVRKNLNAGHEDASIDDLAYSISEQGLLSPVVVRTTSNGHYELIVGQRRILGLWDDWVLTTDFCNESQGRLGRYRGHNRLAGREMFKGPT